VEEKHRWETFCDKAELDGFLLFEGQGVLMRHQKPEIQLKVELNGLNVELLSHHVYLALVDINITGPGIP